HANLRFFPTRRSSDLICVWLAQQSCLPREDSKIRTVARLSKGSIGRAWELWEGDTLESRAKTIQQLIHIPTASYSEVLGMSHGRSEEHTSELQSRFDL